MQSVIDDEWPAMETGHASHATQQRYFAIWDAITKARPTEGWEIALYQSSLDRVGCTPSLTGPPPAMVAVT